MRGAGFWHIKQTEAELVTQWVRFGDQRQQVIGENFHEVYFLHYLAKLGAERAHLGVFGHFGAIEAIYFAF
jgi:hypothetical protein